MTCPWQQLVLLVSGSPADEMHRTLLTPLCWKCCTLRLMPYGICCFPGAPKLKRTSGNSNSALVAKATGSFRMHGKVLCLALGGEGRKGIANAGATLQEPTFFLGRQGLCLGLSQGRISLPGSHESSKMLTSGKKRDLCGQIILQNTLGKVKHCRASQSLY